MFVESKVEQYLRWAMLCS